MSTDLVEADKRELTGPDAVNHLYALLLDQWSGPRLSSYSQKHRSSGDYHERTNQIASSFSPKVILACGNCTPSRAGDHAVDVRCSRSTKRSGACC